MDNNRKGDGSGGEMDRPLARLIAQMPNQPGPPGGATVSLWQRLDMERIARRLIQTARIAAGEHALLRAEEAIRQRDAHAGRAAIGMARPDHGQPAA